MLKSDFFKKDTSDVAKNLLGKKIIRNISGNFFCAKIVETEAYLGLDLSNYQKKNLTNGPGKLTMGMAIDRNLNGKVLSKDYLYIEDFEVPKKIVVDKRVGIDYAGEDAELPLRFYIGDNKFVSKK